MTLCDVNVLVAAHRPESEHHAAVRPWLQKLMAGDQAYGVSELVLNGFVRVVTNRRIYKDPTPLETALDFGAKLLAPTHAVRVAPGERHWRIFEDLCRQANVRGGMVADAYHAALAIESGCEWITFDGDFARFEGLKWRRPF